jgi:lactoylglutathione lyase
MPVETITSANVKQAVPFFSVTNMEASLRFYVDGLGFKMKRWWIPDQADGQDDYKPDGRIRWCWLELGEAAIMLQEFLPERQPKETLGGSRIQATGIVGRNRRKHQSINV